MTPLVWAAILAGICLLPPGLTAARAEGIATTPITLPPGRDRIQIRGQVKGYSSRTYSFGAEAGQMLTLSLSSRGASSYFNLYAPGLGPGDQALANGSMTGPMVPDLNRFEGRLPASGQYTILVYLYRAQARRGEISEFTLDIGLPGGGTPTGPVQGDFADGLQGGPDFYAVRTPGDRLSLRDAPSATARRITRLPDGEILRNLGCRMTQAQRWCRVARTGPEGTEGWVNGRYLVESAAPRARAPQQAGPMPGGTVTRRLSFPPGQSADRLQGSLPPGAAIRYLVNARDRQMLEVALTPAVPGLHFNIFNPDQSLLYASAKARDLPYRGQLWQSGDHVVEVYNTGQRRIDFAATVAIE